jgi:hypothetical protein
MDPASIIKALNEAKEERRKELIEMTNAELSEKLYNILDKELDDADKNTGYGEDFVFWSFKDFDHEIRKPDAERDYDYIFEYCYEIFVYEICNFCGCGCGIRVSGLIRSFLDCFDSYDGTLFDSDIYKSKFPGRTETEMEFMLKWVDSLGLSEHGTSVYGSWLTDKGVAFRGLLRKMDISYEIGSGGNG